MKTVYWGRFCEISNQDFSFEKYPNFRDTELPFFLFGLCREIKIKKKVQTGKERKENERRGEKCKQ